MVKFQEERHKVIVQTISDDGRITVGEICQRFDVSEMTARRDLRILDRLGLLRRVHGGAVNKLGSSYEPPYNLRVEQAIDAKKAIGKKAVELISDGDSIALDIGTTTLQIAKSLQGKHNLTIITASIPIGYEIITNFSVGSDVRLILTGGIVRAGEFSMVGNIAENCYRDLHVDKAFIGLTEYNLEDAIVKRSLMTTAQNKIVVAEGAKLGRTTFVTIGALKEIQTIITDKTADDDIIMALSQQDIDVIIAD
jgi:DeoR/GlpR family transcriptional regulator of sugar metabolism